MRFESYSQRDTPDTTSGDVSFSGIDMTRDRPLLQPGMLSLGENTRTRTGHVVQRRGTSMSGDFNPSSGYELPIIGSDVYRDPNGSESLVIAPSGQTHTWVLQDGKDPYQVNFAGSVTGVTGTRDGFVDFVQGFDKLLLLRSPLIGSPAENLVWDGTRDTNGDGVAETEWEVATLSSEGLTLVPGVWNGEPFMDRIIYYFANSAGVSRRDRWYMSDVEDYSSYDPVFQSFRTNPAESDYITRIMSYFRGSVVIFKNRSIHMATLNNTYPVSITQRILNSTLGSRGNKMPLMVGGDIIFLSQPVGFYLLSEVIQDQITALPLPISEPIQRVIDNIAWQVTSLYGCSVALDNYAFFGVSLKGRPSSGRLNAILVYDTQRKVWESAGDTWQDPTFSFSALHVTNYGQVHRVFAIDYLKGIVYLLYEGVADETPGGIFEVPFKMETRGYVGDDPVSFKRFGRATVGISTADPEITITAISDGFNEEKVLTPIPITKDRTRFYSHGHADFDADLDDPTDPYRQDYSLINNQNFVGEDYEGYPEGPVIFILVSVPPKADQMQDCVERLLVRTQGSWCALRISNNQGTIEVNSVAIESTHSQNVVRTAA